MQFKIMASQKWDIFGAQSAIVNRTLNKNHTAVWRTIFCAI